MPTDRLWEAALTLILLVAVLNIGARFVAKIFAPRRFSRFRSSSWQKRLDLKDVNIYYGAFTRSQRLCRCSRASC